jgi:hypothetical protein
MTSRDAYYPAGVTDLEIDQAAGRRSCPDGYCPLCYLDADFPGALSLSWCDSRGRPIDPDNGLCEECYASWLELLRRRLQWRARQVQTLEAELARERGAAVPGVDGRPA